jgi:hypothetical protein
MPKNDEKFVTAVLIKQVGRLVRFLSLEAILEAIECHHLIEARLEVVLRVSFV